MTSTLENDTKQIRRSFPGTVFTVLVPTTKTNNRLFLAELECLPGGEPPRHVHTFEDETLIIKEGTITFFPGNDVIQAKAGDTVFLPKNVPHHYKITSHKLKALLVTTPGNFENFFCKLSLPYDGIGIPEVQMPTPVAEQKIEDIMNSYGIYYV